MWWWWNTSSIKRINFEDMQYCIKNKEKFIIINTLPESEQECLIDTTILASEEVKIINEQIDNPTKNIIIYGKNCNDEKVDKKYKQIKGLGLYNLCIYTGGLFEWLCLQDIYGEDNFRTTIHELDILKFKPSKQIVLLLTN
jgi:hypothetical protein